MAEAPIAIPEDGPWRAGRAVASRLRSHGFQAWFVGGCVRDLLLGRAINDVDIATDAVPERVLELFSKTVSVGKSFGVVIVVADDGSHVEVATFRSDGPYADHRRPEQVRFGSVDEDVTRRDFTINALLLDPLGGGLSDLVGGSPDLQRRLIRCVGDARSRLAEDPLRVLRAMRFAAVLAFTIEAATWQAMVSTALRGVSAERLLQEWDKATTIPAARARYLELLIASTHLTTVCPPLARLSATLQARTREAQGRLGTACEFAVIIASYVALAPLPEVDAWLATLPMERAAQRQVHWLLEILPTLREWSHLGVPARRRLARHPWAMALATIATAIGEVAALAFSQALERERAIPQLPALLSGHDLRALGVAPGPQLGAMLKRLEDLQLEGGLTTHEQAVNEVRNWLAGAPPAP